MQISSLARSLGLSRQMIYKLAKQGMPTDNVESAFAWRKRNIHPFQSKTGRIGGNSGKRTETGRNNISTNDTLITNSIIETLTNIVPSLWFGQIGWLGGALRDHGIKVTAEQLIKIQAILFMTYMSEVDEALETENVFTLPETLMARPGDEIHSSLIEKLNQILNSEPRQLYES